MNYNSFKIPHNIMNNLLIVSFDLTRENECDSYAIGSLISCLKSNDNFEKKFLYDWYSFNLLSIDEFNIDYCLASSFFKINFSNYTHIAISCYVWSNNVVNPLISKIIEYGFKGEIILGGYEISYSNTKELQSIYPLADYFIKGYGEQALLDIVNGVNFDKYISKEIDFLQLSSPYLSQTLPLSKNIERIRWETKRGCPYQCNFCAHRDLTLNKVNYHLYDKIFEEISLFKKYEIKKINILDPVFNIGKDYIEIIKEMKRVNLSSTISLQVRPEIVTDDFLNAIEGANVILEFGIQTLNESESQLIKRKNQIPKIYETLKKINEREINSEVSLIYGLPTQTLNSFNETIEKLKKINVKSITAFPLMLLKGTELYDTKENYNFKEMPLGKYSIPTVVSSNSFNETEWLQMKEIADSLELNSRI